MTDEAKKRKATPVYSGVVNYFPDAIRAVAEVSYVGNEQHNPGQRLFWDRSKSTDELDALTRHLIDAGTLDTDGLRHSAKVAWRALANLQKEIENEKDAIQFSDRIWHTNNLDGTYTDERTGEVHQVPPLEGNRPHHSKFPTKEGIHPREKKEQQKVRMRLSEDRMNIIGQNGNDGEHYDELLGSRYGESLISGTEAAYIRD